MTTFTTENRILAEKDGSLTINVNAGEVTASPPHIVDSGASVMNIIAEIIEKNKPEIEKVNAYIKSLEDEIKALKAKTLTDEEILEIWRENERVYPMEINRLLERSRAIIKKALEK
jgi:Mg2+ and Co2+ transporter CorA